MNSSVKYVVTLLWMITVITVALLIFTGGFLLKRVEIQEYSSCDSDLLHTDFSNKHLHKKEICWMQGTFQKAVIIIVDALRYDFIKFNKSLNEEQPFQNKLKFLNEILTQHPDRSSLYKFVADPPTTTMQRLKGLTTGSLPTFVDAGANFAGSNIVEDNIIDQLKKQHKKMIFMGDDTWLDLFPSQFSVKYPFPSLNVKDLDTVDNGVISNIFNEMNKPDWDFIIGHFLGVDHCGHTYGPNHPMMAQKLNQMDDVLRKVISALPDEAVLLIFGDHGMTRTGDHGGDSKDELEAGLLIYSNKPIKSPKLSKDVSETVAQIDLVPTLSLLLGLPIPFSNLGKVIPELFTVCPTCASPIDALLHEVRANHLNSNQVKKYLQSYSRVSDEFPHQELLELETMFHSASERFHQVTIDIKRGLHDEKDVAHQLKSITANYQTFLHQARLMCDKIWAQFDVFSMSIGVVYFLICFAFSILLSDPSCFKKLIMFGMLVNVLVLPCLLMLIWKNVNLNGFILYGCALMSAFPVCGFMLFKVMSSEQDRLECGKWAHLSCKDFTSGMCFILFVLYLSGYLSNSYVVYDDSVSSFMLQSVVWLMFYNVNVAITNRDFSRKKTKHHNTKKVGMKQFDIGQVFTSPRTLLLVLTLALCFCLRLAKHFRPCREEQWTCETSQFMQPLSAFADYFCTYTHLRYYLSVACIAVVVLGIQKWLRHHGNLNGYAPSVLLTKYLITFTGICIAFYWGLQALPKSQLEKFQTWQQDLFAQVSYVNFVISIVIILVSPLSVYLLPQEKEDSVPYISRADKDLVPKMYNHLKVNWQTMLKSKGQGRPPIVYGLGTVYSAVLIMLIECFTLLLAMLLGDGIVAGIVLQVIVMLLFLEIHACCVRSESGSKDRRFLVPWYSIIAWCLLCSHFFYATGHQATIPAIRFESAYVGFHGDFTVYVLPVILILLNTFASHALGILALPLLLFWPCVRGKIIYFFEKEPVDEVQQDDQRGELVLQEDQEQFQRALFNLFMSYLLISSSKLLASMLAAGIHRRHLMVWKIFAPRFVFEAAIFLFTSLMLLLVYLIVLRVDKAVSNFIKKLR